MADQTINTADNEAKAPVNRNEEGTAPGEAGDTPDDSVIEDPRDVGPTAPALRKIMRQHAVIDTNRAN